MTTKVVSLFTKSPQKDAIEAIKNELLSEKKDFNIETMLSKISEKERAA
jgi:hypothetical protein